MEPLYLITITRQASDEYKLLSQPNVLIGFTVPVCLEQKQWTEKWLNARKNITIYKCKSTIERQQRILTNLIV